jgi:peptide/nickel transport system ATP-binding protein
MNGSPGVPVLKVKDLAVSYTTRRGEVNAVRNVSLSVHPGEVFGIVGESGCGKTSVAFSIVNFLGRNGRIAGGEIWFEGNDLTRLPPKELRRLRGNKMAMVYQDPTQALNPSLTIGEQLREVLEVHGRMKRREAARRCVEMVKRVYLPDPDALMRRYPHQLSGGQQQRVVIAMALLGNPRLLLMDEPTTALDVTVEATVLDLVDELRREMDTAIVYITHDLGVVARLCDSVGVMYAGEMVEISRVQDIFLKPLHPYTNGLIRCLPRLGRTKETSQLDPIAGYVPSPEQIPPGCIFRPRCNCAAMVCMDSRPVLRELAPGRFVSCHLADDLDHGGARATPSVSYSPASPAAREHEAVLEVEDLKTYYRQEKRSALSMVGLEPHRHVKAVDGVSFQVSSGRTLGIVGESGCGKSTLARTIAGLEPASAGQMRLLGVDISAPLAKRDLRVIRRLQMVFQNPDSTLNPSFTVGYQIGRSLRRFKLVPASQVRGEVSRLLEAVRLDEGYFDRYPHQLSGGEAQRVAVARAIAANPEVVICDEPLSALDVSVQAAILNLLVDLQREHGITIVFIAHDLSVVRFISDHVAVMYLGRICEVGPADAIYSPPYHPYTEALLSAVPIPDPSVEQRRIRLSGTVPSAVEPPSGCHFHTRCPRYLGDICRTSEPPEQVSELGHRILCHIPLERLKDVESVTR